MWHYKGGLFQSNRPVLTGVDAHSSYCFLLEEVEHREDLLAFAELVFDHFEVRSLAKI